MKARSQASHSQLCVSQAAIQPPISSTPDPPARRAVAVVVVEDPGVAVQGWIGRPDVRVRASSGGDRDELADRAYRLVDASGYRMARAGIWRCAESRAELGRYALRCPVVVGSSFTRNEGLTIGAGRVGSMGSVIYFIGGEDRLTAVVDDPPHSNLVNVLKNQGWALCTGSFGTFAVNAANVALIVKDEEEGDPEPLIASI
jgi:hypothetical protein